MNDRAGVLPAGAEQILGCRCADGDPTCRVALDPSPHQEGIDPAPGPPITFDTACVVTAVRDPDRHTLLGGSTHNLPVEVVDMAVHDVIRAMLPHQLRHVAPEDPRLPMVRTIEDAASQRPQLALQRAATIAEHQGIHGKALTID